MLTVSRLGKAFGRLQAVHDVTLQVAPGQIVGLIGPNGSGKSTLLNCIAGSLTPDRGRINFDGHDITGAPPDAIFRLGIARSHQDPALFQRMSVLDNTLLAARKQAGEQARRAPFHWLWQAQERALAEHAGGVLRRLRLGNHYAARAADLSGGQMKLLELGRSLTGEPKLMLLDEPTAGVAPNLAYEIFEQIAALRKEGLTFLIVEHRLEILFDFVDHLFVMHLGDLLAQGSPAEIASNPLVREVYFGT